MINFMFGIFLGSIVGLIMLLIIVGGGKDD